MPAAFQRFQRELAHHLRDPHHVRRPVGLAARPAGVYSELLFNNVCGFLDSCFPVCRELLGPAAWRRLCRTFYRDWPSATPVFREIPREFVHYLDQGNIRQPLPPYLASLARYEWAELAVDVMDVSLPAHVVDGDLLTGQVMLNPARMDLVFDWPVHRIGPQNRPRQMERTHVVVYRNSELRVQFTEVNAVTAQLLKLLSDEGVSGEAALSSLCQSLAFPDKAQFMEFGAALLEQLRLQEIILGVKS